MDEALAEDQRRHSRSFGYQPNRAGPEYPD